MPVAGSVFRVAPQPSTFAFLAARATTSSMTLYGVNGSGSSYRQSVELYSVSSSLFPTASDFRRYAVPVFEELEQPGVILYRPRGTGDEYLLATADGVSESVGASPSGSFQFHGRLPDSDDDQHFGVHLEDIGSSVRCTVVSMALNGTATTVASEDLVAGSVGDIYPYLGEGSVWFFRYAGSSCDGYARLSLDGSSTDVLSASVAGADQMPTGMDDVFLPASFDLNAGSLLGSRVGSSVVELHQFTVSGSGASITATRSVREFSGIGSGGLVSGGLGVSANGKSASLFGSVTGDLEAFDASSIGGGADGNNPITVEIETSPGVFTQPTAVWPWNYE